MNEAIATGKVLDIHQDSFLKKKEKEKRSPTVSLMTQLQRNQTDARNCIEFIHKAKKKHTDQARKK